MLWNEDKESDTELKLRVSLALHVYVRFMPNQSDSTISGKLRRLGVVINFF